MGGSFWYGEDALRGVGFARVLPVQACCTGFSYFCFARGTAMVTVTLGVS